MQHSLKNKGGIKMSVGLFVNFKGNCREAVEFYSTVFGTEKPKFMTFGEMKSDSKNPMTVSEETKNLVMYTDLKINGDIVMFSDSPGMPYIAGNNITISIGSKDKEEIKTFFNRMKVGGKVGMELQETFWSELYGDVTDQFGIPWMFSHDSGKKW